MSKELEQLQEQTIVALLAAAKEQGLDLNVLYERAHALVADPESKIRFIDERKVDEIASIIAIAEHKLKAVA
ncbi:hypothetical protein [Pseudomonas putida]|uniref:hypothetical protein n=1 Tax=Pseudomonas putida TaxID=303 RepID=UPI0018D7F90B|nr:hypothetical protein [Pseudomonas putida]MBH3412563.1 hypothetical protein [Pseudomonas putida]